MINRKAEEFFFCFPVLVKGSTWIYDQVIAAKFSFLELFF